MSFNNDSIVNSVNTSVQYQAQFRFDLDDVNNNGTIVLGQSRVNPFSLVNINIAKTNLYGSNIPDKIATHKYVKFIPTTQEHLANLEAWETEQLIALFDFPLEYEIDTEGEYYYDPSVADTLYTYQYAAIPVDLDLPLVPHVVIEDLYLDKSDPLLIAESFWLTNNKDDINDYVFHGGLTAAQVAAYDPNLLTTLELPEIPERPCPLGFEWVLLVNPESASDLDRYYCACQFSSSSPPPSTSEVNYCECIEYEVGNIVTTWIEELGEGEDCDDFEYWSFQVQIICNGYTPPQPPDPILNACNCPVSINNRYPGGCIRVDFDGVMEPVEIAQVKMKDTWFTSDITYTNDMGCWKINKSYAGRAWMWVYFKNTNVKVRDIRYWGSLRAVKDYVGRFNSPPYNNIQVDYSDGAANNTSNARRFWAAAHSLNTVNQYRIAAQADGIPLPKTDLNWTNLPGNGPASAPMLQGIYFSAWPSYAIFLLWPLNVYNLLALPHLPDITNQYAQGETAGAYTGVGFHELGHASHYSIVGEDYWFGYRNHIVNNGGYGSFGNFNGSCCPGRVALGEAIGEYIGARYGGTFDGGEFIDFDNPLAQNPENYIPRGLCWDLVDDTPWEIITDPNSLQSGPDNISGFTPSMIFNALSPNVNDIRGFRDRLRTLHLSDTPNDEADFNDFLDLYDVFN